MVVREFSGGGGVIEMDVAADYSGAGLANKEIEITNYIWSQCSDSKNKGNGLGVLGARSAGDESGTLYDPSEIVYAPVGIIDTR